jgi:hypothetical protein
MSPPANAAGERRREHHAADNAQPVSEFQIVFMKKPAQLNLLS